MLLYKRAVDPEVNPEVDRNIEIIDPEVDRKLNRKRYQINGSGSNFLHFFQERDQVVRIRIWFPNQIKPESWV